MLASWHLRDPSATTPNSPRIDHWRSDRFVRSWPEEPAPPEFFGQSRQVRVWGDGRSLDGFQRMPLPCRDEAGSSGPLLPEGIYLFRFPFVGEATADSVDHGSFRAVLAGGGADQETVPLVARAGEPAAVIINARQPILAVGVQAGAGPVEPVPAATEVVRLGDSVGKLDDFSGPPRLPDVLCIGGQRSGTTWLHAALQSHPRVWPSEIKEFHQFDWNGRDPIVGEFRQRQALAALKESADGRMPGPDREHAVRRLLRHAFPPAHSWENYATMFAAAAPDRVACDFTPAYATLDEHDVDDIVRVMPQIKVIFILRDPVTRAVSGAIHALGMSGIACPTEAELRHACNEASNVLRTDSLRTLDLWQRRLPEGRMLVLFHDDIARDPDGVVARTCDFLGIDPPPPRADALERIGLPRNAGRTVTAWPVLARVKAELSARWLPMICELERRFGEPVRQWRLAAEARLRAAEAATAHAGAGGDNTVVDNLAQWDMQDPWPQDGDEWDGQARACGVAYDTWKAGITSRYGPLLPAGGTVLEIGPGHGRWSEWLIEKAGLLVLCDISPNCLDACRARLAGRGRLRTHVSQGDDLPTDLTGKIDVVWSYDCLVHVGPRECERYLLEIARVLRPGGVAVVHHADRRSGRFAAALTAISTWCQGKRHQGKSGVATDSGWRSRVSRRDIRRWARRAGLAVDRQETTWEWHSPAGPCRIGVPRFGDCISVLRRVDRGRGG
jgi:SAM-dependent methyltransferase